MTVAEATPDLEHGSTEDRAFLGHPKGLGYLGFTEGCERFLLLLHADAARASTWSIICWCPGA